jgi:hypothetical protein
MNKVVYKINKKQSKTQYSKIYNNTGSSKFNITKLFYLTIKQSITRLI